MACAPYPVIDVAAYIVEYCNRKGYFLNNLKLQKVLYFVQAQFLCNHDTACFTEDFEAWQFGPVVPEVYKKYRMFGGTLINRSLYYIADRIDLQDQEVINLIVDECDKYTASQLVEITHKQDPWKNVYSPYNRNMISKDSIRSYFRDVK